MHSKYQRLAGNTVKLGLGTFGSKLLVFLMVRFYTEYLSPADYGTADLITQTANLLIPLLSLGITDAVFRFAMEETEDAAGVFTAGLFVLLAGSALTGVLALFAAAALDGSAWLIAVFVIASNFHTLASQFVRAKGDMTLFAVQGLLNTALVIWLNSLFLAVCRLGVTGYVLSTALADLLTTVYLTLRARLWLFCRRPGPGTLSRMLRYCVPLIPTATFWWITSVSDRYMITAWLGSAANGIYAVSAKLPTILTVLSSVFMEAWLFSAVTEKQEGSAAHLQFYSSVWKTFVAGMVLSASGVIAFSRLAVRLLAEEEFFNAWQFVPVLCLAMVFASFSTFLSSVYVVSKKSTLSFWTALLGAGSNVLMNFLLILRIGVMGAAIATPLSYVLVFLVRAVSIRRLLPFSLAVPTVLADAAILILQAAFLTLQLRGWVFVQALSLTLLLILNGKPLLLAANKLFGAGRKGVLTAIHGFCMALADSVPGVSGGTIAFILGFYDRFLDALHSLFGRDAGLRKAAVLYLLKLGLGWAVGMGACVLALSKLFAAHIYFMSSLFLGLTLASFPFVIRAEKKALRGQERYAPFAVFGVLLVVLLTLVRSNTAAVSIRFAGAPLWMLGYIFLSGAVAITAMVLPGISGSTILLIAGVYLPAIQAIRAFLGLDFSVLPGLIALGLGVLAGIGLSIHAIRAALRKYRPQMVWLILGLMAGSLYAIIMGPASLDIPQAPVGLQSFDFAGFALGAAILLGLEALRKWAARQTASKTTARKRAAI